jgi:putative nucleotidyltransferase with HDIG domain
MADDAPSREDAWQLLNEHNKTERTIKHALAVEGVMRFMARKHGEDEERWGVIGLLHDLDFERYPEEHCTQSTRILEAGGWPPDYVRAVVSHGWQLCTDVEPQSLLEKTLYAIDELTGLVAATALVRPSRSVMDLKAKSVKKKWKEKRFAAGVDRTVIERGAEMLGVPVADLINDVIAGMQEVAAEVGLAGADD